MSWLYDNRTTHTRYHPFERRFSYRLTQIFIDIDAVARAETKLFRYNRPGLFAFYDRDFGPRDGAPLRASAEAALAQAGIDLEGGPIWLLCMPRVLGYVFNPLSIYFGYGPNGALRGVIYEVTNTFGERHSYACGVGATPSEADKALYVSPFFAVSGKYVFHLRPPGADFSLAIENVENGRRTHLATLNGRRAPLTDAALLAALARAPCMTLAVMAAIHWHALLLWLRGATHVRKQKAPETAVSVARAAREKAEAR